MDGEPNMKERKKINTGRLLSGYLRSKRKGIALFLLCMLVFYFTCLLYQFENISKLLYAFFLWAFIGFCYGTFGFIQYVKGFKSLQMAFMNIENMQEILPPPEGAIERQYRQILDMLLDDRRQLLSRASFRDTDMTDYYSMWAHQIKVPIAAMRLLLQNAEDRSDIAYPDAPEELAEASEKGAGPADTPTEVSETGTETIAPDKGADTTNSGKPGYNRLLSEELFKIEQYVEMVLYYQRLDSINSDFMFKEYDLREVVNQTVKKHSMFFINSGLTLDIEDFSLPVVTDEKWLQFVIGQVLSNSLKYTSRGGISIRLERSPGKALLIIEDTGIGIRPEDLPRVFERGFTGYNGRLEKKSTGIGLYLSKKILDKLSHTIEVTSEAGKGTRAAIGFILTKM